MQRRTYLRAAGVAATGLLAGCAGDSDGEGTERDDNEVLAGPDGNTFEPETLTISTGETVTWTFESGNHNVECDPEASEHAALPDGADPFASYEGDNRFTAVSQGETYEHTFDVAGTYDYICVPHVAQGMRATVVVEE